MEENLIYIKTENIWEHPDNPRKDLGDLSELSESIKKHGIMQNLTVIKGHWDDKRNWCESGYTILIGHRRFAAGKIAGITKYPCRLLESVDLKEQMGTMLEENMQRNDLTVWEQANGFQMMLDLGETEDSIAEKTGFCKATIRHRLNIAKLDQGTLQEKEQDNNFQMSLTDLYELEKIPDVEKRNEILRNATNSRDLASRVTSAVEAAKRDATKEALVKKLELLGVQQAPDKVRTEIYTSKWTTLHEFDLCEDVPAKIKLPKSDSTVYWLEYYRSLKLIIRTPKVKKEMTEEEKKKAAMNNIKNQISDILKNSSCRRKDLINDIISGKTAPVKTDKEAELKDAIWEYLISSGYGFFGSYVRGFFLDKEEYKCSDEEKKEAAEKADHLTVIQSMLLVLNHQMNQMSTLDYNMAFNEKNASYLSKGYAILSEYGWFYENEEEKAVIDGSHPLYDELKRLQDK